MTIKNFIKMVAGMYDIMENELHFKVNGEGFSMYNGANKQVFYIICQLNLKFKMHEYHIQKNTTVHMHHKESRLINFSEKE